MLRDGVHRCTTVLAVAAMLMMTGCGVVGPSSESRPDPVHEALWIADGAGVLRAYDGRSDRPVATVEIGTAWPEWHLVGDGGVVWAYADDGRIVRVATASAAVTARHQLPHFERPGLPNVLYGHATLWVQRAAELWRVTDTDEPALVRLPAGVTVDLVAAGARWLWVTSTDGGLIRVDPVDGSAKPVGTNPALRKAEVLAEGPDGLVFSDRRTITVLDPDTVAERWSIPLPADDWDVSLHPAVPHMWAVTGSRALPVQNPATDPAPDVSLGDPYFSAPTTGLGSLWIGDDYNAEIVRIRLTGDTKAEQIPLPYDEDDELADLVLTVHAGQQALWIVDFDGFIGIMRLQPHDNGVTRVVEPNGELTTAAVLAGAPGRLDP